MRTQHNTATARRRWLFLAFPALVLALTMALARPASAQRGVFRSRVDLPIIQGVSNPCTGVGILLTGVDRFLFEITFDNAGGFHSLNHSYARLTGIDNQGNEYIATQTDTIVSDGQVGLEQTRSFTLPVVGTG